MPSFVPIFDVPDITFRVTQDVDGDGDQETIYAESFFDVRWNAGPIPPVTLHTSAIAVAGLTCDGPEVPCETPEIVLAGLMPLHNLPGPPPDPYLDGTTGYAQRPNRPHSSGLLNVPPPRPPTTVALLLATTPFTGTLQLYGCNQYEGAQYYRMRYTFEGSGPMPFTNTWQLWRWVGSPGHLEIHNVAPDGSGWYPILPDAKGWMPAQLLFN